MRDKFLSVTSRKYGNKIICQYSHIEFFEDYSVVHIPGCPDLEVTENGEELMKQVCRSSAKVPLNYTITVACFGFLAGYWLHVLVGIINNH